MAMLVDQMVADYSFSDLSHPIGTPMLLCIAISPACQVARGSPRSLVVIASAFRMGGLSRTVGAYWGS
ncbi:MAG: hypothetical protein WDN69_36295 [Aliidongia sp.]